MEKYGVDTSKVKVVSGYSSFSSCIFLSEKEKTRTCVFYKGDIPALKLSDEQKGEIEKAGILMVDGNEMDAAIEGAKKAHESGAKVLYDAGGLYDGVGNLIKYADILIPSEEFALGFTKKETAEEAAKALYEAYHPDVVVITQGKKGGIMFSGKEIIAYPRSRPKSLIPTARAMFFTERLPLPMLRALICISAVSFQARYPH